MGLEVGQNVGDYEILGVLGTGGMGKVYRVRNTLSDRIEAMKVLLPDLTAEPETAARFMAEIRILAAFSYPNIARLRTAFHLDNQLVMMMELVEGQTVEYKVKRGRIPQHEALGHVLQLLSALSYAHARGVVHRDIKPANLMVTPLGVVKLMDFGIAKSEIQTRLTRPGTTVGSLHYMSPEQMRGGTVDPRSDLYSVGVLLYELLTGRRPFESNGVYSIVHMQLNMAPQSPIEINPLISRPLNNLILQSLAKDPAGRFQSAEAFAKALRALTAHRPEPKPMGFPRAAAPNPSGLARPIAPRSSSPGRAAAILVAPVSSPAARAAPQSAPQLPKLPSFWNRIGWVGVGAFAVIVIAGAAVELPLLLKTGAPADDGSSVRASTAAPTSADRDYTQAREQELQLESRASAVRAKLARHSATGRGARPEMDREYTQMHSHLQAAEDDLKIRNIVASRTEMEKAQNDIWALESKLSQ